MNKELVIEEIKPIEELESLNLVPTAGPSFESVLQQHSLHLSHSQPQELQLNLGKLCNLACHHCHVDAGPKRTELMSWETMGKIADWAESADIKKVDLTGGAPELNPHFRGFCDLLINKGIEITSRCNITVLYEQGQQDLARWYAQRNIRLVCSLPCYKEDNVDQQRGNGTFDKSIAGLQLLNSLGYGHQENRVLDLVYNPIGAHLPPAQAELEDEYKIVLRQQFAIEFSKLLTITNIPINRFAHQLRRDKELEGYQQTLVANFNANTVEGLMCRHQINVDWLGRVYDCDFNQMLNLPMEGKAPQHLWDLDFANVEGAKIATDRHCFACTAGAGSSCGGSLDNSA